MKDQVLKMVKGALGDAEDNLYRANMQFRNYSDEQLDEKYGQSDNTCREILDGYKAHKKEIEDCVKWVEVH